MPYNTKEKKNANQKKRMLRAIAYAKEQLRPCDVCGLDDHRVMHWHHRDPSTKSLEVSKMVHRGYAPKIIQAEIDKCACLCANCHAILHYDERNT